jgi:hypothetical protein
MPSFLELRGQYGKVKLNRWSSATCVSCVLIEKDVVCDVSVWHFRNNCLFFENVLKYYFLY